MKKDNDESDELRPEYRREDFGQMVRGKYAERTRKSSNTDDAPLPSQPSGGEGGQGQS